MICCLCSGYVRGVSLKAEYTQRLQKARQLMNELGISTLLITPGPNLRYFTGYKAKNLERLTCLVLRKDDSPKLIVPLLEENAALDSGLDTETIEILTWQENKDPYQLIGKSDNGKIAIDSAMNATKVLIIQKMNFGTQLIDASVVTSSLRIIKSEYEKKELQKAGEYIDQVHEQVPTIAKVGMTEKEVAKILGNLIIDMGHETIDFTIVATGKNSASPHHEPGNAVIERGDSLVVDIGGTLPSGYCSDSTRTYFFGDAESEFLEKYNILKEAQKMAREAINKDIDSQTLDNVSRDYLKKYSLDKYFIHRTGHGIGLETHEEPYIVQNNELKLVDGMAFSIEPGFYISGLYGARIEDIVIRNGKNTIECNNSSRDLKEIH